MTRNDIVQLKNDGLSLINMLYQKREPEKLDDKKRSLINQNLIHKKGTLIQDTQNEKSLKEQKIPVAGEKMEEIIQKFVKKALDDIEVKTGKSVSPEKTLKLSASP